MAAFVQRPVSPTNPWQGVHREENWALQVEQPQAFLPPFSEQEGEKQLDRGTGWLVMPDCVHKDHAEPEKSRTPVQPAAGSLQCPRDRSLPPLAEGNCPEPSAQALQRVHHSWCGKQQAVSGSTRKSSQRMVLASKASSPISDQLHRTVVP